MAYASFQDFIEALDRAGELIRIADPLSTDLEIAALADQEMKMAGGGKALLIEKPLLPTGETSPFPVAINTMGSEKRMAMALGGGRCPAGG
jgi:4-hydroxy-3-polyprenylbenzoate decarboxylase